MEYRKKKKQMCSNWVLAIIIIAACFLIAAAAVFKAVAEADSKKRLKQLDNEVQYQNLVVHLKKLDTIKDGRWNEANINKTATYLHKTLSSYLSKYYDEERRPVTMTAYDLVPESAVFTAIFSGSKVTYEPGLDFSVEVPPEGYADINDVLAIADNDGCSPSDYVENSLTIVRASSSSTCTFEERIAAAAEANVTGLIIILRPEEELTPPTKRRTVMRSIPVFTVRDPAGSALVIAVESGARAGLEVNVNVACNFTTEVKTSYNLLFTSKVHKTNHTVIVGAHMDSSPLSGTAVNDNGSGMAAVLELARLAAEYDVYKSAQQKIIFAFWGLGEEGQLGSLGYLEDIKGTQEFDDIVAYINADMLGSPNYAYFVTNPEAARGQKMYNATYELCYNIVANYIHKKTKKYSWAAPSAMQSDHLSFWSMGIPTVNICSGTDGTKTAEEYEMYGGYIYAPYDSCYHRSCDNLKHMKREPFEILAKTVAHTAETLLVDTDITKTLHIY